MKRASVAAVLIFALAAALAQSPEERGLAIAQEAKRRDMGFGDSAAQLTMILRDRGGEETTRELRSQVLERPGEGDRSLVVFDSPRDIRGTAMLTVANRVGDDDQWLYLPALKRVRRIAPANKSGPFMGSEFAYEDFVSQEVEKFTHRWLRDEPCPVQELGALTCFVVERTPVDPNSGYSRQVTWIDREHYRTAKIEYFDRREAPLKTLALTGFKQYAGKFWRPDEMLMANQQTGKSTRLLWSGYEFGVGPRESDFTPQGLTRAR
jgi:outer membrane lipoprotein-sorting protein